jgi:hypothetical protein
MKTFNRALKILLWMDAINRLPESSRMSPIKAPRGKNSRSGVCPICKRLVSSVTKHCLTHQSGKLRFCISPQSKVLPWYFRQENEMQRMQSVVLLKNMDEHIRIVHLLKISPGVKGPCKVYCGKVVRKDKLKAHSKTPR